MVSLDGQTGALRWATPILTTATINGKATKLAIGSGKAGMVIAADAETGQVIWKATVGMHSNDDLQTIPEGQTVEILPGVLGGVE
jgi:outer membrane protein assembly factor BamB